MSETNPVVFTPEIGVELIDVMGSDTTIARAAWISTGPDERERMRVVWGDSFDTS